MILQIVLLIILCISLAAIGLSKLQTKGLAIGISLVIYTMISGLQISYFLGTLESNHKMVDLLEEQENLIHNTRVEWVKNLAPELPKEGRYLVVGKGRPSEPTASLIMVKKEGSSEEPELFQTPEGLRRLGGITVGQTLYYDKNYSDWRSTAITSR